MQSKKILLPLLSLFMLLTQLSKAQLNVVFKDNTAFLSVKVDTGKTNKGKIDIDKLPDSIVLNFPDEDFQNFSMQFNKDSLKFFVGFGCSGDSCVKLFFSDIKDGKVVLHFSSNKLIAVNNRSLHNNPKEVLVKDKKGGNIAPYVGIVSPKKINPQKEEEKPVNKNPLILDTGEVKKYPQQVADIDEESFKVLKMDCGCDISCSKETDCKGCCNEKIPSEFNQLFLKPCEGGKFRIFDKAVTPKYRIVIDERKGALNPVSYLKLKNKKDYQYYKVKNWIHPVAGSEIALTVIGNKDSTYVIDSSARQNFMEYEKDFAAVYKSLPKDTSSNKPNTKSVPTTTSVTESFLGEFNVDDSILYKLVIAYSSAITLKAKMDTVQNYKDDFIKSDFIKFVLKQNKNIQNSIENLLDQYIQAIRTINTTNELTTAKEKEIKKLMEKIEILEERIKKTPASNNLKSTLKFIEMSLIDANFYLTKRNALLTEREAFIVCLNHFVNKELYIVVPDSPEEFTKLLQNLAASKVAKIYFTDFDNLIKKIEAEYKKLVSDKTKYGFFTKQVQVPNTDEIDYGVKTSSGREIFKRSFRTSLGFKIDFSTGFFVSGLTNSDFLVIPEAFRYKETKDSISTANGQLITTYTGRLVDTSGKIIRENKKLTFNTGFIIHAYTRSGTFANVGLAVGTLINESQIQFLLGGSLLFNVGKQRLALTGGCTFGKQKTLNEDLLSSFITIKKNCLDTILGMGT
jgi:translation initiation factor 2 beta subunit (eIF-2beta)/eIF-5